MEPRQTEIPGPDGFQDIEGTPVLVCSADGAIVRGGQDALDLIGEATYHRARWVVVPSDRFGDDFFQLRTRVAGEIVQKFVNYRLGLAIVGDISRHIDASDSLRDFVR